MLGTSCQGYSRILSNCTPWSYAPMKWIETPQSTSAMACPWCGFTHPPLALRHATHARLASLPPPPLRPWKFSTVFLSRTAQACDERGCLPSSRGPLLFRPRTLLSDPAVVVLSQHSRAFTCRSFVGNPASRSACAQVFYL